MAQSSIYDLLATCPCCSGKRTHQHSGGCGLRVRFCFVCDGMGNVVTDDLASIHADLATIKQWCEDSHTCQGSRT